MTMKQLTWFLFNTATALVGYAIHQSIFWAVVNFLFAPLAWLKWLIFHEVNLTIIREAFSFFIQ